MIGSCLGSGYGPAKSDSRHRIGARDDALRTDDDRPPDGVWQTDFSEFETTGGGIWRLCAVIDYATEYCLAISITPTGRGSDALACLHGAIAEAERVLGLHDLHEDRGRPELADESTGEVIDVVPAPIAVVSDNGSCFRGETYQTTTRCSATSAHASDHRRPTELCH